MPQAPSDRLDSWKEIANYFKKGVRTIQRWEKAEGLPVHRHSHQKSESVYAYAGELNDWWNTRKRIDTKRPNSIAVLPFVNMSSDPDSEYFSDGIAEELINNLSKIPGLKVVARTSSFQFKGKNDGLQRVGEMLRVSNVVEGSVRQADGRLRITVRLVDVKNGFQLWSETYSRRMKDVFAIQEEIARKVVSSLQVTLATERSDAVQSPSLHAFHLYLKARYQASKRTQESLRKAVDLFQQAVSSDPSYASAHAGLAEAYALLASGGYATSGLEELASESKTAANNAVQLEPSLGEAHAALALVQFRLDWNWQACEREFRIACELNPSFATAHHWFALYLAAMGRSEEALVMIGRAQNLDPLSLIIATAAARVMHFGKQYDAAIAQCQRVLDMEPHFAEAHLDLGMAYLEKDETDNAIQHLKKAAELSPERILVLALLGHAYGRAGNKEAAIEILQKLESMSFHRALVLTGLGRTPQAIEQLERAVHKRSSPVVYLKVEPIWATLRADLRFKKLLRTLQLTK